MLTIKHVEADGHESITPAHSISYWPDGQEGDKPMRRCLDAFGCPADAPFFSDWRRFSNGRIYVMNDKGATVGSYDLN